MPNSGGVHYVSPKGVEFISSWEQCPNGGPALTPYQSKADAKGVLTIGYGHVILKGENFDKGITQKQALAIFEKDLSSIISLINDYVKVTLTQQQFDALTSYVFNTRSLIGTKMLINLNNYDYDGALLKRWI